MTFRPVRNRPRPPWRNPVARLRALLTPAPQPPTTDYSVLRMLRRPYSGAEMAPNIADAPGVLRGDVSELNRAGGLDEGNGRVFDTKIRAWTSTWAVAAAAEHEVRQSFLRQREDAAQRRAEHYQLRLDETENGLAEIDARIAALERRVAEAEDTAVRRSRQRRGRR